MIARIHIDKLQILNDHLQSPFIQNLIFFSGNEALKIYRNEDQPSSRFLSTVKKTLCIHHISNGTAIIEGYINIGID